MAESRSETVLYFEDLEVGQVYRTDSTLVTEDEMIAFASRYDPQPFHLDALAGKQSVFGALAASGWLTASLTMRLMITSGFRFPTGVVGLGVNSLRWPRPVFAGDTLVASIEVTGMRPSQSKPGLGVVTLTTTTSNQRAEIVQLKTSIVLVPRRNAPAA